LNSTNASFTYSQNLFFGNRLLSPDKPTKLPQGKAASPQGAARYILCEHLYKTFATIHCEEPSISGRQGLVGAIEVCHLPSFLNITSPSLAFQIDDRIESRRNDGGMVDEMGRCKFADITLNLLHILQPFFKVTNSLPSARSEQLSSHTPSTPCSLKLPLGSKNEES
jgi:hypothetical protein